MISIVGWDVGGANVKATWLGEDGCGAPEVRTASLPFEIWRAKERLPQVLAAALAAVTGQAPQAMALTMTAELADVFATKREGVLFVLDSMAAAFPGCPAYALSLAGDFCTLAEARSRPLDFAAANWLATALWLAPRSPDCLLVDAGSTTTDIVPIQGGRVAVAGRTDLDRLQAGELVYTGALRTPVAAIVQAVPVRGRFCPVASEYFAVSGDVHLVLGHLAPANYSCPTPDGRPATIEAARGRLARVVCADSEQLAVAEIDAIARYIYDRQVEQIGRGLAQVLSRLNCAQDASGAGPHPVVTTLVGQAAPRPAEAVTTNESAAAEAVAVGKGRLPVLAIGLGAFLVEEAARRLGLPLLDPGAEWGRNISIVAPSWAAAHLLAQQLTGASGGTGR